MPTFSLTRSDIFRGVCLAAAAAAVAVGLAVALTTLHLGTTSPLVALAGVAATAMLAAALWRPALAAAALVAIPVIVENTPSGYAIPNIPSFYDSLGIPVLRIPDVLVIALLAAVAFDLGRSRRRPCAPGFYTATSILMVFGVSVGIIVGVSNGAPGPALIAAVRPFIYLMVIPPLIVNLPWQRWSQRHLLLYGLGGATVLVVIKAALGLAAWASGRNAVLANAGDAGTSGSITYYEPTANFIMLLLVLCVLAALFSRVRLRLWITSAAVPAFLCFLLSFRRSLWIGGLIALIYVIGVVLFTGSWTHRRRTFAALVSAAVVALGLGGCIQAGVIPVSLTSSLAERVNSLTITGLTTNVYSRYRLDEQANILSTIAAQPLTGVGFGVPWKIVSPLSLAFTEQTLYSHNVVTSWWLKMGVVGAITYLVLMVTVLVRGLRLWRTRASPLIASLGLGTSATVLALVVAEQTASFTGVDERLTIVFAVVCGVLAVPEVSRRTLVRGARRSSGGPMRG